MHSVTIIVILVIELLKKKKFVSDISFSFNRQQCWIVALLVLRHMLISDPKMEVFSAHQ